MIKRLFAGVMILCCTGGGMDLPVLPPHLQPKVRKQSNTPPPPGPIEEGEDPIMDPPPTFFGEVIEAETDSIIYVLDFSASMSGERRERLVKEFKLSVNSLPDNYFFTVIGYSCYVRTFFNSLVPATRAWKDSACAWVESQKTFGQTNTSGGVIEALNLRTKHVVLLTDGAPNCHSLGKSGESHVQAHRRRIRENNIDGATIDVFGLQVHGAEFRAFCQRVATDSGGSYNEVH